MTSMLPSILSSQASRVLKSRVADPILKSQGCGSGFFSRIKIRVSKSYSDPVWTSRFKIPLKLNFSFSIYWPNDNTVSKYKSYWLLCRREKSKGWILKVTLIEKLWYGLWICIFQKLESGPKNPTRINSFFSISFPLTGCLSLSQTHTYSLSFSHIKDCL